MKPAIAGVSLRPWSLQSPDGRWLVPVDLSTRAGATVPLYPTDQALMPGDCVQGWLIFIRGVDLPILQVRYQANGPNDSVIRTWTTQQ